MTHPLNDPAADDTNARRIAREGLALLTRVGSTVHGVTVDDQDDRDELGICVEPRETVVGIDQFDRLTRFEQWEYRSQPIGARSGPGDLDCTVYSLRKWMRLATQGNPSVLVPLFVPVSDVWYASWVGVELRAHPDLVLSRRAGRRFLGYMNAQRAKLLGDRGGATNRPELIHRYGFDTKFAYHMIRLGLQGVELLRDGRITLPIPEPERTWLRDLRVGRHSRGEALEVVSDLENKLEALLETSPLPPEFNRVKVNEFLIEAHQAHWREQEEA